MLAMLLITFAGNITLKTAVQLAPVPAKAGVSLQNAASIEIDHQGRYLVVDAEARTIFVWDQAGHYFTHFGRAGEGPGEFNFGGPAGVEAYLTNQGDHLFLWDGGRRVLNRFAMDLTFVDAKPLDLPGRVEALSVTADQRMVVFYRKVPDPLRIGLALYSKAGKLEKTLMEVPDPAFNLIIKDGSFQGILYHAFAAEPVFYHDLQGHRLLLGMGDQPMFQCYDEAGQPKEKVRFKAKRLPVTEQHRAEYLLKFKPGSTSKADFADVLPYYTHLCAYGQGYLVYSTFPHHPTIEGVYVDQKGAVRGAFRYHCGEDGALVGVRNRLIAMGTTAEGEVELRELRLDVP